MWAQRQGVVPATRPPCERFHGVDAQDPAVEAENDLCQQLGRIILAVTSRRLRSCAVHTLYPNKFVGILDEGLATSTLNDMREDEELFNHLKTLDGTFWQKVLLRTPFQHVHTQQMFSIAKASEWKRSETLVHKITQQWSGVTQSNIVENCIREQGQSEISKNFKKMSEHRCWHSLISGKIDVLFLARPQKVPHVYKEIVYTKAQAPHPTSRPCCLLLRARIGTS